MSVALALLAAVSYGLSDFVGGLVSRRAPVWGVAVVVQLVAAVVTAAVAVPVGGNPSWTDVAWCALSGVASGSAVGFLFRGLASARMSVVAPLSAVGAAVVPVAVGLLLGERPGTTALVGIAVALPGIWLVASGEDAPVTGSPAAAAPAAPAGVVDGVVAGVGFGAAFVALAQVEDGAGLWPLTAGQAISAVVAALLATALGAAWRPGPATWRAAPAGVLSAVALLCFQVSVQGGLLTVTAVLTSLYPAATVLLAMAVLRERVSRSQAGGLLLCAATVTLVAWA